MCHIDDPSPTSYQANDACFVCQYNSGEALPNGNQKRRVTRSFMVTLYATFYGLYIRIFRWSYMHTIAASIVTVN